MNAEPGYIEQKAAAAFDKQSVIFDSLYSGNTIVRYKRERVRAHVLKYLSPGAAVLELNSGTGEDTVWFAGQGYRVHATDISTGMQNVLMQKIRDNNLQKKVSYELCSFTELDKLENKGPYHYIFSNFAGLNCTNQLDKGLQSLSSLLLPGGTVTLVVLPSFCLWEFLLLFKGKFKTAFRRLFSSRGATAHIEGEYFKCWYYNPSYILKNMPADFRMLSLEGLCTFVPPSYIENFAEKYPRLFNWLKKRETQWKAKWPWKYIGDYYIISLRRNESSSIA